MVEKSIGKTIAQARKKKKISQEQLAKYLHVSRQTISNWENDLCLPAITLIVKLCEYLSIDIEQLLIGNVENINIKHVITNEKKNMIKKIGFIALLLISIFIFILLILFLLWNYNKVSVYKVSLKSEEFQLYHGIFVDSKVRKYFQLGSLIPEEESSKDNYGYHIKLYYLNQNKTIMECDYSNSLVISEEYGYQEYFTNKGVEDIYIDISYYENGKEKTLTYPLQFELLFKSDLFHPKKESIATFEISSHTSNSISSFLLQKAGYSYDNNKKIYNKDNFQYNKQLNTLYYSKKKNKNTIFIDYHIDSNWISLYILKSKEILLNLDYDIQENKITCYSLSCKNYEKYLELIQQEYIKIKGSN